MTEKTEEVAEQQEVVQEQVQQAEEVVQEEAKAAPEKTVDHNWQEANRVLKTQQQRIQELENMVNDKLKPSPPPVEKDEFDDLDPNDYLTVDKARKMAEKLAEKKAEAAAKKIVQEYAQQQNLQSDETRARTKYDDYDYVIENFAIPQINNNPALALKISQAKNPAETAYKIGRLSDDYEEYMAKQTTSPKAEKILKNVQRPVSSNAVTPSLKKQADDFSKLSKEEIWRQAEQYAKRA
jgi:hypothetical protein